MNAKEARQLAEQVTTDRQALAVRTTLAKIQYEAQQGRHSILLFPELPDFIKPWLEGQGYTVKQTHSGNQLDGPMLEVSW